MRQNVTNFVKGGSFLVEAISCEAIFTPEDFTEEHAMIAKTAEDFVEKEIVPQIEQLEEQQFDRSLNLLKKAGELGLLSIDIPESYGGIGLDKISSAIVAEKIARAGSFSITHGAHVGIGTLPIVFFGNETQKQTYLPKLATGEYIAAYALTEPSSGSDALGAKTKAALNKEGTHYILNGEKQWITNAGFADIFIVYAKVDGEHFTAFIVEKTFPGVSVGPEEKKMGLKGSSTRTLLLEDAMVPKENVLGEIGKGHKIAFNILNVGRNKLAVGAVGASKRVLELAAAYATERKQFQMPLSQFTAIQEKIANMAIRLYAMESSVWRTVGLFEQRFSSLSEEQKNDGKLVADSIAEYAIECSLNKVHGSETLDYIVDEGVQIYGGYGYMSEYEVERAYRDSRINRIFEGTNEINRLLVPATLLKKALNNELPLQEKALALQEELLMMMPEEVGAKPLDKEKYLLNNAKKIVLLIAGLAAQKLGRQLQKEQELLINISDMVNGIYTMESSILRTEKSLIQQGEEKLKQKLLMTEVYCQETFQQIELDAKESVTALEEGDARRILLSSLRKLTRYTPINTIKRKREIATAILEAKKYIV